MKKFLSVYHDGYKFCRGRTFDGVPKSFRERNPGDGVFTDYDGAMLIEIRDDEVLPVSRYGEED